VPTAPTAFTANTDPTSPQNQPATPTMVPEAQKADAALQQKEGDATAQPTSIRFSKPQSGLIHCPKKARLQEAMT
jgi:hypothetical protein